MADDFQVTRAGRPALDTTPGLRRPTIAPDDPEAARAEIEATRARMSETIDEIEDVLLAKKEKIRDQFDVLAPVRENPVKTLGMLFGAALVLGLLTGGGGTKRSRHEDEDVLLRMERDDEEDEDEEEEDEAALAWQRAEEWEDRAHRLLRIAKVQEDELEIHRARRGPPRRQLWAGRADHEDDEEYEDETSESSFFERIRDTAAERLAVLAGEISHRMMRGG
jgi:ElaB/YqjD/DUF883 family membrane-anchored ribosome-binding protein